MKPHRNLKQKLVPRLLVADAETDQDDVLLQSTETEESEEETEDIAEEEESTEESGDEPPKAVGKLLKQVNKLTARAKSAEETAEALQAQIESLKTKPSERNRNPVSQLSKKSKTFSHWKLFGRKQ